MFVGIYQTITNTTPHKIKLAEVLMMIKEGRWKNQIERYREHKDSVQKELLPAFAVGGVYYPTKAKENLREASGVLELDVDDFEGDFDRVCSSLRLIFEESLMAVFRSAGGSGLCVLIKIKPYKGEDQYKRIYNAAYHRAKSIFEDVSKFDWLPNSNRLRFVSYDPHMFINNITCPEDYLEELEIPQEVTVTEKGVTNKIVFDGGLSDDERFDLVVEKYVSVGGDFGSNGKSRHDWVLGLARWCCRADIDERWLVDKILANYHHPQRASVWRKEVERCVRDSYRTYSVERGEYVPAKKFSYDDILGANNVEEVREQVLLLIADKINYVQYLTEQKKSSTFVEKEIKFLKKLINYL